MREAMSLPALTGVMLQSRSPWKTISGTSPAGPGDAPASIATSAEKMSCAAPCGSPL
jgi:hypothetical protein